MKSNILTLYTSVRILSRGKPLNDSANTNGKFTLEVASAQSAMKSHNLTLYTSVRILSCGQPPNGKASANSEFILYRAPSRPSAEISELTIRPPCIRLLVANAESWNKLER